MGGLEAPGCPAQVAPRPRSVGSACPVVFPGDGGSRSTSFESTSPGSRACPPRSVGGSESSCTDVSGNSRSPSAESGPSVGGGRDVPNASSEVRGRVPTPGEAGGQDGARGTSSESLGVGRGTEGRIGPASSPLVAEGPEGEGLPFARVGWGAGAGGSDAARGAARPGPAVPAAAGVGLVAGVSSSWVGCSSRLNTPRSAA